MQIKVSGRGGVLASTEVNLIFMEQIKAKKFKEKS